MDCRPPGSSLHGILQARMLEWVAMPSSRGSSDPWIKPQSLISLALAGGFFPTSTTWEVQRVSIASSNFVSSTDFMKRPFSPPFWAISREKSLPGKVHILESPSSCSLGHPRPLLVHISSVSFQPMCSEMTSVRVGKRPELEFLQMYQGPWKGRGFWGLSKSTPGWPWPHCVIVSQNIKGSQTLEMKLELLTTPSKNYCEDWVAWASTWNTWKVCFISGIQQKLILSSQ